jgi:maltooligosyltrehalose trehalohydrolase
MGDHDKGQMDKVPAWGCCFVEPGRARFRLWAPQVDALSLRLESSDIAMTRDREGWFEAIVDGVEPGSSYCFVLPDRMEVPDPASRWQKDDVHGRSLVTASGSYPWATSGWKGRPWREAVIYELHVGTFTPEGTFDAARERLSHLARLGVTVVELMPLAQFAGTRGWGYDGVLPYAPHNAYGTPDALKRLIDEAHRLGLMVMLDVVYNHFGPDGNYLPVYASDFFDASRHTPWGAAIAYERGPVRDFFIQNAIYWLGEFRFDGLRLDAVDQIRDPAEPEMLVELAQRVRAAFPDRHIHLATEDNRNIAWLHDREDGRPVHYTAEWNDDFHNAAHVHLTGEQEGYYADFAEKPLTMIARCLAEGFAYQGEPSVHAGGTPRGEPSGHLPPTAFISFLQNHDQTGNRALGDRLSILADAAHLRALSAILLLSPHIPLLFMGEEWLETRPFLFFTDFSGQLADDVREGRRKEFAGFSSFGSEGSIDVPDPNAIETFRASKIDWDKLEADAHRDHHQFIADLLAKRHRHIVPLLDDGRPARAEVLAADDGLLAIDWRFPEGVLRLRANLGRQPAGFPAPSGELVHGPADASMLDPHDVCVVVER